MQTIKRYKKKRLVYRKRKRNVPSAQDASRHVSSPPLVHLTLLLIVPVLVAFWTREMVKNMPEAWDLSARHVSSHSSLFPGVGDDSGGCLSTSGDGGRWKEEAHYCIGSEWLKKLLVTRNGINTKEINIPVAALYNKTLVSVIYKHKGKKTHI